MSDDQTPDVTVEDEAGNAAQPGPDAPAHADAPASSDSSPSKTPRSSRGRRDKRPVEVTDAPAESEAATPADDRDVADVSHVADDAVSPDEGGQGDEDGMVHESSMSASDFEAITGELTEAELFDPDEVANAPRAPHPLKPVVEALIFASPEPLTLKAIGRLLDDQPREDIEMALAQVREGYLKSDGLQLVEVAGGFQIVTRPELYEWVRRLFKERTSSKLSVQALETLAVIAYKQPVTSGEIAEIRGVTATTGVLNTLLDRKLVKIVGRKQVVGRPFMYGTTREFLDKFGLKDLSDLPKVEDMSEALGFDLPTPVDADGVSLPFDQDGPGEPLLFADEDPPETVDDRSTRSLDASSADDAVTKADTSDEER